MNFAYEKFSFLIHHYLLELSQPKIFFTLILQSFYLALNHFQARYLDFFSELPNLYLLNSYSKTNSLVINIINNSICHAHLLNKTAPGHLPPLLHHPGNHPKYSFHLTAQKGAKKSRSCRPGQGPRSVKLFAYNTLSRAKRCGCATFFSSLKYFAYSLTLKCSFSLSCKNPICNTHSRNPESRAKNSHKLYKKNKLSPDFCCESNCL
jgi:hypothetical protein